MNKKRTESVKIRMFPEEKEELKKLAEPFPLAEWMRTVCLGQPVKRRRKELPKIDPKLLRQLSGIGNNVNQIARQLNSLSQGFDKVYFMTQLLAVEEELKLIREAVEDGSDLS